MTQTNDQIEVIGIFPTPIYFANCDIDISTSIQFLDNCQTNVDVKSESNNGEYGSISLDTYILNNEHCQPLKAWISHHLHQYSKNVLAWKFNNISITQSWVSIKRPGEKHKNHKHPNSLVSGIFYWEDDVEDVHFVRSDRQTCFEIERDTSIINPYAWDLHKFSPRKNTLILFPSEVQHGVDKNSKGTVRKCLAFNSMIFEKFGSTANLTELDFSRYL